MTLSIGYGQLMTEAEVAEILRISVRTLQAWRVSGDGPRYSKIGRAVRYRRPDIENWVLSGSRFSTSDDN
ncbi:MAG: helix-turn-helix domain-containing protein [Gammaproteobacteria bacterium]|nr:helix-turn-helix domain-containing protein [Gammaproteobacteria bacterium]